MAKASATIYWKNELLPAFEGDKATLCKSVFNSGAKK